MDSRTVDGVTTEFVSTIQYINMAHSRKAEEAGVSTQGTDVLHEVMESYYQAKIALGKPKNDEAFKKAHSKALKIDGDAYNLEPFVKGDEVGLVDHRTGKKVMLIPITDEQKAGKKSSKSE